MKTAVSRARDEVSEPPSVVGLKASRALWVQSAAGPASEVVSTLAPGARIVGVTKGQFGLTELLGAILRRVVPTCGPADVVGWAWSMAPDDARMMSGYRRDGLIRSLRVLFDRSFPTRHPEWVPLLRDSLGEDIYATNNHAKVLLIAAGGYRLVVQSSMNFNINRRFEHFSIEDDAALFAHWSALTEWMCARTPRGLDTIEGAQFHEAFKAALGGGVIAAHESADATDDVGALLGLIAASGSGDLDVSELLAGLEDGDV